MAQVSDYVNVVIRGDATRLLNPLRRVSQRFRRLAVGAQQVGMAFAAFSAVAVTALRDILTVTLELDGELRKMASKVGVEFDSEVFQSMVKDVRDLGSVLPLTTSEVAKLGTALAQAGVKGRDEMASLMKTSALMAESLDIEGGKAGEMLLKASKQFDIPDVVGDKYYFLANQIAFLASNSEADAESISESYKMIGSVAGDLGLDVIKLNSILRIAAGVNISGSMAGRRGVQAIQQFLTNNTADGALVALGLPDRDSMLKAGKTIDEVAQIVNEKLDTIGADPQKRMQTWKALFGMIGMPVGVGLAKANKEDMAKFEADAARSVDTITQMYNTRQGGILGQAKLLMSAFEAMKLSIGDAMGEYLTTLMRNLTALTLRAKEFIEANPQYAFDLLSAAVMGTVAAVASLGLAMAAIGIASFVSSITAVAGSILSLLNPVSILVILIAAIADYATNGNLIQRVFGSGDWGALANSINIIRDSFKSIMMMLSNGDFKGALNSIKNAFIIFADGVMKALKPMIAEIKKIPGIGETLWAMGTFGGGVRMTRGLYEAGEHAFDSAAAKNELRAKLKRYMQGQASAKELEADLGEEFGFYRYAGKGLASAADKGLGLEALNTAIESGDRELEQHMSKVLAMKSEGQSAWDDMVTKAEREEAAIKSATDRLIEMKEARKGLSEEERKALGEKQAAELKEYYGEQAAKRLEAQMAEEKRIGAVRDAQIEGTLQKIRGFDWLGTMFPKGWEDDPWHTVTATANLVKGAEQYKRVIESVTYGKIGDFDSNTAMAKMNTKLNETVEKQLRELQEQTFILEDIKNNTGNALKVGI